MSEPETEQRLDIWLWRTRFFKTRGDAAKGIASKGVRIDRTGMVRKASKPGTTIMPGDVLTFRNHGEIAIIQVIALPHRRGPASEAQTCYETAVTPENQ